MPRFWKGRVRLIFVVFALFVVALCGFSALAFFNLVPPKEQKLIANFNAHRADYEGLRDMISAEEGVNAVYADRGVTTRDSPLPRQPSEVNFPMSRYDEYVGLLKAVGSDAVFRVEGNRPERVCVGAWAAGWAGDTRHIWVCWVDAEPANRTANLDDYYRSPTRPRNVFRHVDENWYLKADR
jgi:hypothetical protein